MKRFNKILLSCLFFLTFSLSYGQQTTTHKVMPGETLYSIGKKYGVSVSDLQKANKLENENIRVSQVLVIPVPSQSTERPGYTLTPVKSVPDNTHPTKVSPHPQQATTPTGNQQVRCKLIFVVEKKMSVVDVCKKFNVSEKNLRAANPGLTKDKLKKDDRICIPYTDQELASLMKEEEAAARRQAEEAAAREAAVNKLNMINVALILPFELSQERKSQEAIKMIDFYEGLLLAVSNIQSSSSKISIEVIDESEKGIQEILNSLDMKEYHLIIGAKSNETTNALRTYSKSHNIPLAVPFSSREDLTVGYPTVFQVNSKASMSYSEIYNRFLNMYPQKQIVFVSCSTTDDPEYIKGFQRTLDNQNRQYSDLSIEDLSPLEFMFSSTDNIVLIPTSKNIDSFKKIVEGLEALPVQVSSRVTMFGYPEWQTFSQENTDKLHKYHCSFYTTFYADLSSQDIRTFNSRFKNQFKRDQFQSRPLYGLLGYDVTNFFLGGMEKYGKGFIGNQHQHKIKALQNPMSFTRNGPDSNGFINKSIGIVNM